MGQRLPVAYINTILPSLCCYKTPISFEVAMHPAKRLQFVSLLSARCGHMLISCQNVKAEYCMVFWKIWEFTFPAFPFLLPVRKTHSLKLEKPSGPRWGVTLRVWWVQQDVDYFPDDVEFSYTPCTTKSELLLWERKIVFLNHLPFCFSIIFNQISFQLMHHMKCLEPTYFQAVKIIDWQSLLMHTELPVSFLVSHSFLKNSSF